MCAWVCHGSSLMLSVAGGGEISHTFSGFVFKYCMP